MLPLTLSPRDLLSTTAQSFNPTEASGSPSSAQISIQIRPPPKLSSAVISALQLDNRTIASDVDLTAELAEEPELGHYALAVATKVDYFEETPARNMIGRTGLVRKTLVVKIAEMHLYGDRCHITLTINLPGGGLQFAHVIAVSFAKSKIRLIEWIVGQGFNTLNIHSSRLLWLLTPDMHWGIDHGLFKLIPSLPTLRAILAWLEEIASFHAEKQDNSCVPQHLHRDKVFPPGNYEYILVVILAHHEFVIPRLKLFHDVERSPLVRHKFGREKFSMRPINVPLVSPQEYDRGDPVPDQDERWWATMGNLKNTRANGELDNLLKPKPNDKYAKPYLELPQCPVMVTLNVVFWLLRFKNEVEKEKVMVGGVKTPKTPFSITDFIDPSRAEHVAVLRMVLKIAEFVEQQKVPGHGRVNFSSDGTEPQRGMRTTLGSTSTTTPQRRAPSQQSTRSTTLVGDMPPPDIPPPRPRTVSNASQGSSRYVLRSNTRNPATDTSSTGASQLPIGSGENSADTEVPQRSKAGSDASQSSQNGLNLRYKRSERDVLPQMDVQVALQHNHKPPRSRTASDASQRASRPTTRSQTSQLNTGLSVGTDTAAPTVELAITSPIPSLKRRAKSQGSQARSKRGRLNDKALDSNAKGKGKAREAQLELDSEEGDQP
ncbi:hypothetical protein PQX77_015918 [Marasmius sp. AFHP31]|nr:hypothetical protein PQX77_015918 [Marasmius sp. AFHP31]